jgi:cell division septation protein DedD
MQSKLVLLALSGLSSAFTPAQVKDDLDAHPWRPSPSAPVIRAAPNSDPILPATSAAAPATAAPTTPVSSATGWQLQLAALSSIDAARSEQKRLEKTLGEGKVEILSEASVHRLRFGAYASKEAAETAREELRTKGVDGFPVKRN